MRISALRIIFSLLFAIVLTSVVAQQTRNYHIHLTNGDYLPQENIESITKSDALFQKTLFGNKNYLVIQFYELPDETTKTALKLAGLQLMDYLPYYAYTAVVNNNINIDQLKNFRIRSITSLNELQKSTAEVRNIKIPAHAVKQPGFVDLTVLTYEKLQANTFISSFNSINAVVLHESPDFRLIVIRVPQNNLSKVAELPFVQWVEFIDPPNEIENLPGRTLHRVNILQDGVRNLKGDGINIGIWDGGAVVTHTDFLPAGRVTIVDNVGAIQHASHCAGTLAGKGLLNPVAKGMAPNASLFSWDFNGDIASEMTGGVPANNLVVSSHSYGFNFSGACNLTNSLLAYTSNARSADINLNNFPQHLMVQSSGNSQGSCSAAGGYFTITGSSKASKNGLVVANVSTSDVLSASSSCGPLTDGRIKPEIAGMGSSVFSTSTPTNTYATLSGTSMATPGVAGSSALLYQRFRQLNGNTNPPSALIKNVLCNTARDLGNPGPDYRFGFGRIDALSAVRVLEEDRYISNAVVNAGANEFTITVPANATKLKVMITWNDPAGASNAAIPLVNDLDMMVFKGTDTTRPWILDKFNPSFVASRGKDNVSNIEQVTIDNPTGIYTVRTEAISIGQGPSQSYFISWEFETASIEVLYPNGGESLSPSGTETITWNNAGFTGTQNVEYSLDNGSTWTTIASSLSASTTRLTWNIPAGANTSTALIRVTSGSISDVSDANFSILGAVTGFAGVNNCNAGELSFSWTAVANASSYELLRLNSTTGNWDIAATNITGTNHTITGLTPLTAYWFSIRSKNAVNGAVSERSNAISRTTTIAGSTIGAVSGTNTLCAGTSSVAYNIPSFSGASSYTWSVPTGATIVSGQGTTDITVDYGTSAVSGNVSVVANDANSCSSLASTRAITVNVLPAKPVITPAGNTLSTTAGFSSYKWYLNNVLISGATSNSYNATTNGLYKVEVADNNGCANISDEINFALTSLNDVLVEGSKISLFPNPVRDILTFKVAQQAARKLEVTIISAEGKVVKRVLIPNGVSQINMSDLLPGSYLVRISSGKENKIVQIQVMH